MRILIAYDASADADRAVALAASLPPSVVSAIRVVSVVEPSVVSIPPPRYLGSDELFLEVDPEIVAEREQQTATAAGRLRRSHREVEELVVAGRPGTILVEASVAYAADVLFVGSRGRSPITSLLLGSVSAEVADTAPCPVLVARTASVNQVLFATDGSAHATLAEEALRDWPWFAGLPIRVVSVADLGQPWNPALAPTMATKTMPEYAMTLEAAATEYGRIASIAAGRLRAAGRTADASTRTGDAAAMVIAEAEAIGADLVVIGSRGRRVVARLVLGSVARNIVYGSAASVLVVTPRQVESQQLPSVEFDGGGT